MSQEHTPEGTHNSREELEARFLKDFRAGEFLNPITGVQNPFKIETWWHQELQKAREEDRKIIKLRIDYDRRKGIPAEETVNDIYDSIELKDQSELDQPTPDLVSIQDTKDTNIINNK